MTCSSWHQESFTFQCSAECQGIALYAAWDVLHRFLSLHVNAESAQTPTIGGLLQMMNDSESLDRLGYTTCSGISWNFHLSAEEMATAVSSSSSSLDFGAIPRYLLAQLWGKTL